jgi:capsid protein
MKIGRFHFGYNAVEDKSRRQAPTRRVRHEAEVLKKYNRERLIATAQEQARNHALVAWMVRKHLDYVSKFHFSFRTGKPGLDNLVNRIFRWHGRPGNLDFGRRFGRDELFRLFEMEKVLAGDAAFIKLPFLKLQAIESDLIANGEGCPRDVNDSGLLVDEWGRVEQYAICQRQTMGRPKFHHMEPADNVIFDAYWTRLSSQFRGVSPLSTAINTVQDIHEAFEFNLIKAKMHALFGVAVMRDAVGADGDFGGAAGATAETAAATATDDGSTFDLNPRSINIVDLNPGEKIELLESRTPSGEFVDGSYLFIQIAMLALDIPITSFDSRRSSFSARIADLNEYEVSCDYKRTKNRYVRQSYSDWVLQTIWNDEGSTWPLRRVAEANKMRLRDVQEAVEWIPSGSPWLDKYKQVQGDQLSIDIGLDNSIDAARRRGQDVFDNIDKQAQVIDYARQKGVPLLMGKSGARSIEEIVQDEVTKANVNAADEKVEENE